MIAQFRAHWEHLEDLRAKIKNAREALRYNRGADWVLSYLLEEFRAEKQEAKKVLRQLRQLGPDGRKVKEHKNAFLKRFDRAFGEQVVSVHRTYCQALSVAQELQEADRFVTVKVRKTGREDWPWEVVGMRYRVMWWLEFQRRGAPHLHMIFFDVREGLDWEQVRAWVGPAWAAVVAGVRSAKDHDPAHNPKLRRLLDGYDHERELWGKALADAALRQGVEALGLDWGIFQHVRAGTRLEEMRKGHWAMPPRRPPSTPRKNINRKCRKTTATWADGGGIANTSGPPSIGSMCQCKRRTWRRPSSNPSPPPRIPCRPAVSALPRKLRGSWRPPATANPTATSPSGARPP